MNTDEATTAPEDTQQPDLLRVATVGPAHGLRGDVRLLLHTDDPQARLAPGMVVHTEPPLGPLTVDHLFVHGGQYHVRFQGHQDRDAAEALRGTVLLAPPREGQDGWYTHQLRGLTARTPQGQALGTIVGVQHLPAQDVLVLRTRGGSEVLVPFVTQIVPEVDIPGGTITIDPPGGLLPQEVQP